MDIKFKKPYVGARKIFNFRAYTEQHSDWVYFSDKFTPIDDFFLDPDGVIFIENKEGYLIEKKL